MSTCHNLLQVLSKDDPPRKTYVYKLDVAVSAQWISLAVGPFEVLPDQQFCLISHMCLPANFSKLRNTVEFFHSAFRFVFLATWSLDVLSVTYFFFFYTSKWFKMAVRSIISETRVLAATAVTRIIYQ